MVIQQLLPNVVQRDNQKRRNILFLDLQTTKPVLLSIQLPMVLEANYLIFKFNFVIDNLVMGHSKWQDYKGVVLFVLPLKAGPFLSQSLW